MSRRLGRRRLVAVVAITLLGPPIVARADDVHVVTTLATAAVAVERAQRTSDPPQIVEFIGDSLGTFGRDSLETALSRDHRALQFDTAPGRSVPEDVYASSGLSAVRLAATVGPTPAFWIIELGTNDVNYLRQCECASPAIAARNRISAMLDLIPTNDVVIWVDVENFGDTSMTAVFNQVLQSMADDRLQVVHWAAVAHNRRSLWFVDAKHLTSAGYTAWAELIAAALDDSSI